MTPEVLVRGWVRLYTAGLEPDHRTERGAEIESDLWEHRNHAAAEYQAPMATSLAVLGRWVAGIPADLSWRTSQLRQRQEARKELIMTTALSRHWWQALAAVIAAVTVYFGVRQFFSDEVSTGLNPGKVVALVLFVGFGVLTLVGLGAYHARPRQGAAMIMIGMAPVALVGGLGFGIIAGLIASLVGDQGWWWLPVAIASAVATVAGIGAFSAWWDATPARSGTSRRVIVFPGVLVVMGLLAAASGVGMGLTALGVGGVLFMMAGLAMWGRRAKIAS